MAHKRHYVDGKPVPSVTTVTSRFGDKGGLIFWANAVGLGERDCEDQPVCESCGRRRGKNHREASKKAAQVGDLGHALIEERVKAVAVDWDRFRSFDDGQKEQGASCLEAFDRWFKNSGVEIIETEFSFTSQLHRFGGTFDAVGFVDGRFSLIDWKTSKGIYADYVAQLGGYVILVEEAGFQQVEQIDLLRFSKETASFEHRSWVRKSFQPAIDFFLHARQLYDDAKALDRMMK